MNVASRQGEQPCLQSVLQPITQTKSRPLGDTSAHHARPIAPPSLTGKAQESITQGWPTTPPVLDQLVKVVVVEVIEPEIFAVREKVHAASNTQVRVELMKFRDKVAGEVDVGDRNHKGAASI